MSNLTSNKIAAAILCAGLIGIVTGKVTQFMYDGGIPSRGHHEEGPRGYKIEVVEVPAGGGSAPAGPGDLSALYAGADLKAGEDYVNKKCTVCHDVSKGGANKVGPHIWGVVNRKVASADGFNYSSAMKAHPGSWSVDDLNKFLWSPSKTIPGTMMSFAGISKDQERANVIAYIATKMTDSPAKLPTASAKPAESAAPTAVGDKATGAKAAANTKAAH